MIAPTIASAALAYARRGWRVVPLHSVAAGVCSCPKGAACPSPGKHPRLGNWTAQASTDADVVGQWWQRWPNANVGIAFGAGLVDIELDNKKGKRGPQTFAALEARLGKLPPTYTWRSGGGLLHRIFTVSEPIRSGIEVLGDGVDVLHDGRQAVAPPSMHMSGKRYELVDGRAPAALPRKWLDELAPGVLPDDVEAGGIDLLDRDLSASLAEAEELLNEVPADDYDRWLKIGMALRHQWQDTPHEDEALALWDRWSAKSAKYTDGDCAERWHSFAGSGVTFATLRYAAKECGGRARVIVPKTQQQARAEGVKAAATIAKKVDAALTWADARSAAREGRAVEMDAEGTASVVSALCRKAKTLSERISKVEAEALVSFDRSSSGWYLDRAKTLGWRDSLYWQQGMKPAILQVGEGSVVEHGRESFNVAFAGRFGNGITKGGKAIAVDEPWDVAANLMDEEGGPVLPRVAGYGYKPGAGRAFHGADGASLLANTWKAWGAGDDEMLWTDQEAADVALWQQHLVWLVGKQDAETLVRFMAWVVQKPHVRIKWCYTMIGPEGCGKSIVAHELMRAVLGKSNVSVVGPADLANPQYNGWANAGAFGCIDELHVDADSRQEFAIVNALKPALTDSVLRVSDKYRKAISVANVTTWYATTNFVVPFRLQGDESRRWFFARSRFAKLADVRDALGGEEERAAYFIALGLAATRSAAALRGWLAGVSLVGFDPHHAPSCAHMATIMESSSDAASELVARAIEEGAAFVGPQVIGMRYLWDKVQALMADTTGPDMSRISQRGIARKLVDLGWHVTLRNEDPWKIQGARDQSRRTTWYTRESVGAASALARVRSLADDQDGESMLG